MTDSIEYLAKKLPPFISVNGVEYFLDISYSGRFFIHYVELGCDLNHMMTKTIAGITKIKPNKKEFQQAVDHLCAEILTLTKN